MENFPIRQGIDLNRAFLLARILSFSEDQPRALSIHPIQRQHLQGNCHQRPDGGNGLYRAVARGGRLDAIQRLEHDDLEDGDVTTADFAAGLFPARGTGRWRGSKQHS